MPSLLPFPSRRLDDPDARKVIAALEAVGDGRSAVALPTMSASFRDELRAQLVAVTPRLVAEGVHTATEAPPRTARAAVAGSTAGARPSAAGRAPSRTRPMTVLVAGAAVVVLGLGGVTWLARGALPGDPLYGLKRTAEGVDVSLSGSDFDKGHALLVDAQTRVEEVSALIGRPQSMAFGSGPLASGALSDSTVKLIVSTLQTADTDTHKGVMTIGDDAITRGNAEGLNLVALWAPGQQARIDTLVRRIPAGPAHAQAETSASEIRDALTRAKALSANDDYADKTCRRDRDRFGQTPCLDTTTPTAPSGGSTGSTPAPGGSSTPSTGTPGTAPGGSAPATPSSPTPAPSSTTPTAGAAPGTTTTTATARSNGPAVAVDSCGVQVSLPVAGVSLGTCTPGG